MWTVYSMGGWNYGGKSLERGSEKSFWQKEEYYQTMGLDKIEKKTTTLSFVHLY